jgi:NAD dependent epimerase/dehydratase
MTRSIFVTGASGFIGSHLTEKLVEEGYRVKALSEYNSFNDIGWLKDTKPHILEELEIVSGDVRDSGQMMREVRGFDCVLHLASLIAIPYSYKAPQSYIDTNISGTLNILNAAIENDATVIHTSTSEVYGTAEFVPMDETHPLKGQSPYSASKIGADQLAFSFFSSFDLPVKIIRPFNTFGPRQSLRAVIPVIIGQILSGAREIKLGSLEPKRDFNFIQDTVEGFLSAITSQNGVGQVTNLGSGFEVTIGDTAKLIAELMDCEVTFISDEQRKRPQASEVNRLLCDNTNARERFGWTPRFAGKDGLKAGLASTIDWFSDFQNVSKYRTSEYYV